MKIKSTFTILDVKEGRDELLRHFGTAVAVGQASETIPVVIYGEIAHVWGGDDGISREFEVLVQSVHVDHCKGK